MTESRIGKYRILDELGRGAMGIVYKAEDPTIGRLVAVKTIRIDADGHGSHREEAQKRFLREAQAAGGLSHPNIVTVYEVGECRGMTYIAMAYINGSSLEDLLKSGTKFTVQDALDTIIPIAEALESAHRKGIIHRDIKPGNILIDREGRPYLADFGIARVSSSTMTQTHMVMGTPFYMSPEQVAGRTVDNRSDVFALGAVLYEMLTSRKPFPGDTLTTVIYKIMNEPPPPLELHQTGLPGGIDHVIRKALAKDPEERHRSCREFIEDLKNHSKYAGHPAPVVETAPAPERKTAERPVQPALPQPEENRKPLLIVLASMMALVLAAIAMVLLLNRSPKPFISSSGEVSSLGPEEAYEQMEADPQNMETRKRNSEALIHTAPGEIEGLVHQYIEAVHSQALTAFYRRHGSPALVDRIFRDTERLEGQYQNLSAAASNIRVDYLDTRHDGFKVTVRFAKTMTGTRIKTGQREPLFDGIYRWDLERDGDRWIITNIGFDPGNQTP